MVRPMQSSQWKAGPYRIEMAQAGSGMYQSNHNFTRQTRMRTHDNIGVARVQAIHGHYIVQGNIVGLS